MFGVIHLILVVDLLWLYMVNMDVKASELACISARANTELGILAVLGQT